MAHFKTGHLQREMVLDVTVAADVKVGDLVKVSGTAMSKAAALSDAQYIVAQSDMTMGRGHIPVEYHDHKYSDVVKASTSEAKKVAVFPIIDKNDVIA